MKTLLTSSSLLRHLFIGLVSVSLLGSLTACEHKVIKPEPASTPINHRVPKLPAPQTDLDLPVTVDPQPVQTVSL